MLRRVMLRWVMRLHMLHVLSWRGALLDKSSGPGFVAWRAGGDAAWLGWFTCVGWCTRVGRMCSQWRLWFPAHKPCIHPRASHVRVGHA